MFDGLSYDYKSAHVLVTGGSNGIGLAIARAYLEAGADVTITGRKEVAADYEHDLTGFGYRQMDVANKDQIRDVAHSLDQLDILVNNAGGRQYAHESEWDPAGFDAAFDVNLSGMFHLSDACLPVLKTSRFKGGPNVIGIASTSAYFGYEPAPGYSAVKAGMIQLIKSYASTWAQFGVRANAVSPGFIETNLTRPYLENLQWNIDNTPLGRIGVPDDIAAAVLFLTSPAASWITGQTLVVDGGFTISK